MERERKKKNLNSRSMKFKMEKGLETTCVFALIRTGVITN